MGSSNPQTPLEAYFTAGEQRAHALRNRGPLQFGADGKLDASIRAAYDRTGFYIFEDAIDATELADFDRDLESLLDRAPADEGSPVDKAGRPVAGLGREPVFLWAERLSDPWGGTKLLNGRHPVRMEDVPAPPVAHQASAKSIFLMIGLFGQMPSALRLSAHPGMMRVAESLNGPDFVPYNDTIFLKEPGRGAAVAWHQDGTTHWSNPNWTPDIHGFNFMAQMCRTTPANGLWVVPGSHRAGHIDIPALVEQQGGSTRLPDAVPMLCNRGDIVVCNRQCLHGSFANASPDRRVTFVWGFFRHDAVLDVEVDLPATSEGAPPSRRRYTADLIQERARLIQHAIDARKVHRPEEEAYQYAPTAHLGASRAATEPLARYAEGFIFI
jgi:ectoine hydroxylase-related dioxygenase (phytanoyl-CoA dioxygenase family)